MTEQEIIELKEDITAEDSKSMMPDDDEKLIKLMYAIVQLNDLQMNLLIEAEKCLKGLGLFHRDIKGLVRRLKDVIRNNIKSDYWKKVSNEEIYAMGVDSDILELLVKKFYMLSNKIAFFGGVDVSIGQKLWAVPEGAKKPILVKVNSGSANATCSDKGVTVGAVMLSCTRLNERTAAETKDTIVINSMDMFETKEEAKLWIKKHTNL